MDEETTEEADEETEEVELAMEVDMAVILSGGVTSVEVAEALISDMLIVVTVVVVVVVIAAIDTLMLSLVSNDALTAALLVVVVVVVVVAAAMLLLLLHGFVSTHVVDSGELAVTKVVEVLVTSTITVVKYLLSSQNVFVIDDEM